MLDAWYLAISQVLQSQDPFAANHNAKEQQTVSPTLPYSQASLELCLLLQKII